MASYLQEQGLIKPMRGDQVKAVKLLGRRVTMSASSARRVGVGRQHGFTLIELVITLTVLSIMTLGVVPLMQLSVKRQKEEQLRSALRQMRMAIDEFRRDTVGMPRTALGGQPGGQIGGQEGQQQQNQVLDPRSKVVISDPTIFGVDNPDLYPPDLETLVNGVNIIPRAAQSTGGRGLQGTGTAPTDTSSVLDSKLAIKKKVYLRSIPIDPMTGEASWDLRSCYDSPDVDSWGGENVFDVRSKSKGTALNGEKYSDW
jgi:general secretion pathway protein G